MKSGVMVLIFVASISLASGGVGRAQEAARPDSGADPVEGKVEMLERTVRGLEDANQMLIENLVRCTEENQELAEALENKGRTPPGEKRETPLKRNLVRRIQMALRTEADVDFLMHLERPQLEQLLELLEKRLTYDQS